MPLVRFLGQGDPPSTRDSNLGGEAALIVATYVVLALPVGLFLIAWCVPWLSIPAVLALAWSGWALPRSMPHRLPSTSSLVFALCVGTIGFSISGAGGVGPQGFDQIKHNSLLFDLLARPWPVFFSSDEPLVYYLGYYLIPAGVGKFAGWEVANLALAAETWILYVLAALWIVVLADRLPKATLLLFAFFSGLDAVGNWIVRGAWGYDPWWARLQFSDPAILIISVPQHVSIGWIGAALIREADRLSDARLAVTFWALSAFWSPFVTLGLAPFVLYVWLRHRGFRQSLLGQVAIAALLMLPAALFYSAGSRVLDTYRWSTMGIEPATFALFVVLEWGLYGLLLVLVERRDLLHRPFALLAMASLAMIPLVSFPGYTDYVARASIPALFFLALEVANAAFRGFGRRSFAVAALWVVLLIGAFQPWAIYRQAFRDFQLAVPDRREVPTLPELGMATGFSNDGKQYIGRADTVFFRYAVAGTAS